DAEGAEFVASLLHREERAGSLASRFRQVIELGLDGALGLHDASPRAFAIRRRQQGRQTVIALRADDQIDMGRAAQDLLAFRLGLAAGHRKRRRGAAGACELALPAPYPAELRIHLLRSLFADVAG